VSEFKTSEGIGRLLCKPDDIRTRYVLHMDVGGRAVMVELLDRPTGLRCDDQVRLVLEDGRSLVCQILDDTPMCTVIGDGFLRAV
jgi:hypothetical protein